MHQSASTSTVTMHQRSQASDDLRFNWTKAVSLEGSRPSPFRTTSDGLPFPRLATTYWKYSGCLELLQYGERIMDDLLTCPLADRWTGEKRIGAFAEALRQAAVGAVARTRLTKPTVRFVYLIRVRSQNALG